MKIKGLGILPKRLTQEAFLTHASKKHNHFYDYSKVIYKNRNQKAIIICPKHGEFEQGLGNHLNGQGCPICAHKKRRDINSSTKKEFVKKAQKVHDKIYRYNDVIYYNSLTKIEITCPKHGSFLQTPNMHLLGHGCPECASVKNRTPRIPLKNMIRRANARHHNKYDYSLISENLYNNARDKQEIICPEHGSFIQSFESHLRGCGCPTCANNGFKKNEPAFLYYFKDLDTGFFKIGITNNKPKKRFPSKNIKMIKIWKYKVGIDAFNKEQKILEEFADMRIKNNNFKDVGGYTEFFNVDILALN